MTWDDEIHKFNEEMDNVPYAFCHTLQMRPSTTAGDLQTWLDSQSPAHMQFEVRRLRDYDKHPVKYNLEDMPDTYDYLPFSYSADDEGFCSEPWKPKTAIRYEKDHDLRSRILVLFAEDAQGNFIPQPAGLSVWIDHAFKIRVLDFLGACEQPGDTEEDLAQGVFLMLEHASGFAIPVTVQSVVRFTSKFDGTCNELNVLSATVDQRERKYFPSYYTDKPVDLKKAQRYTHQLETIMQAVLTHDVDPRKYLTGLESHHLMPSDHERTNK